MQTEKTAEREGKTRWKVPQGASKGHEGIEKWVQEHQSESRNADTRRNVKTSRITGAVQVEYSPALRVESHQRSRILDLRLPNFLFLLFYVQQGLERPLVQDLSSRSFGQ